MFLVCAISRNFATKVDGFTILKYNYICSYLVYKTLGLF